MKKAWLLVAIVVIVLLGVGYFYYTKSKDQADAPSFSKLSYSETMKDSSCNAAPTGASCFHNYVYKANGTEEDLAQSVIDDFVKQGYKPLEGDAGVHCSTDSGYTGGAAVDRYYFQNDKSELANVDFVPPNDKTTRTNTGANFGCTNQSGEFKVLVHYSKNQR